MPNEPHGRARKFTDAELRQVLNVGLKPAEIARKYGVSAAAVSKRINRLKVTTVAAAVAPEESRRYVSHTIDAMAELTRGLARVNLLQDACHQWLIGPVDPDRPNVPEQYDIGPRSDEVTVIYEVITYTERSSRVEKRKAPLSVILAALGEAEELTVGGERFFSVQRAETKHSDPRELVLKTVAETRQTVQAGIELMDRIRGAREMEAFREEMLAGIAEAAPEVSRAIEERLRARLVRWAAATGLGALPG